MNQVSCAIVTILRKIIERNIKVMAGVKGWIWKQEAIKDVLYL